MTKVNEFARPANVRSTLSTVADGGLFLLPNDVHRKVRKDLRVAFCPALLEGFWDSFNTALNGMKRDLSTAFDEAGNGAAEAVLDVSALFQTMSIRLIFNVAFGSPFTEEDVAAFGARNTKLFQSMMRDLFQYPVCASRVGRLLGLRDEIESEAAYMDTIYRNLIRKRRTESPEEKAKRTTDLLDVIVGLKDHTEDAMVSNAFVFGIAGSHTTAAAATWAVYFICGDPDIYRKVQEEVMRVCGGPEVSMKYELVTQLKYLKQVWKETLRLQPPGQGLVRISTCDVELPGSGIRVKRGTQVYAYLGESQRDPEVWHRPDEFVPERWDEKTGDAHMVPAGAYVPYSAGQKNCPGSFLADFEGVLMIAELFRTYEVELTVERSEVVAVSGWASAPCTHDPDGPTGNLSRGVPIRIRHRKL